MKDLQCIILSFPGTSRSEVKDLAPAFAEIAEKLGYSIFCTNIKIEPFNLKELDGLLHSVMKAEDTTR